MTSIVEQIREGCAWVTARARHVQIRQERIPAYAASLPAARPRPARAAPSLRPAEDPSTERAFWLTLDAINFGSGWFPTLRKQPVPGPPAISPCSKPASSPGSSTRIRSMS